MDEVLRRKINNDATAFLRSFSEKRGRNPKIAETAITDARAFTEQEALDDHLIDLVASDKDELLRRLNADIDPKDRSAGLHVKAAVAALPAPLNGWVNATLQCGSAVYRSLRRRGR